MDTLVKISRHKSGHIFGEIPVWFLRQPGDRLIVFDEAPKDFRYLRMVARRLNRKTAATLGVKRIDGTTAHLILKSGHLSLPERKNSYPELGSMKVGDRILIPWVVRPGEKIWEPGDHQRRIARCIKLFNKNSGRTLWIAGCTAKGVSVWRKA